MKPNPKRMLAIAAALLVLSGACDGSSAPTEEPPVDTTSTRLEEPGALSELGSLVNEMEERDGALIRAVVDFTAGRDREVDFRDYVYVTYPIDGVEVLWAPSTKAADAAKLLEEIRLYVTESEEANAIRLLGSERAALVYYDPAEKNTELVAPIVDEGTEEALGVSFRLASIADELMTTPLTIADPCERNAKADVPSSGREAALLEHIDAMEARSALVAARADIEATAQRLVDDNPLSDAVTGETVEADIGDLIRQLEAGVRAKDVEFVPVVQMIVDMTQWDRGPLQGLLFSGSGDYLGWMGIGETDELWVAEVPVPRDGSDIIIETATEPVSSCGELPEGRDVLLKIPFAVAAGPEHRALVNFATGAVTPLTADGFMLLAEGA